MQSFVEASGIAVPMIEDDINTDQIAPLQLAKGLKPDYADLLFKRQRLDADGSLKMSHVLNQPQFKSPTFIVAGQNFGCGSSRESAVWCLMAVGIRCIVARSIADIFRENCLQNGVLSIEIDGDEMNRLEKAVLQADGREPFTVNLENQMLVGPQGFLVRFEIPASEKTRLLEGLDEIGLTMKHEDEIRAWEARALESTPWLQTARDKRVRQA